MGRLWVIEAVDEKMGKPLGIDAWRLYFTATDQWGGLKDALVFDGMLSAYAKYGELKEAGLLWRGGADVSVQLLKTAKEALALREQQLARRREWLKGSPSGSN